MKKELEKEIDTTKEIIIKDSLKGKDNLKDLKEKEKENIDDKEKNKQLIENVVPPKKEKVPVERTVSAPPTVTEVIACCSCPEVYSMSGSILTRIFGA